MESTSVATAALAGSAAGLSMSPVTIFLNADVVVQFTLILLLAASIWCWAIIFEKYLTLRRLNRAAGVFESAFWSGGALEDLYDKLESRPRDPMSAVFVAAMREWGREQASRDRRPGGARSTLEERLERAMQLTTAREIERVERYMTFLASTGSTAPFIGLFGTVWGIMNAFHAIGLSNNTSLAAVAPGISEALFATALGLLAAIPAVLAYNKLSRDIDRYAGRLEGFAGEFLAILSRQPAAET